jgi:hypothetical protein
MQKLTTILQEILGSKARVAVLRNVIKSPGIAARSIETRSGMSWGAIRPSVDQLVRLGVIEQDRAGWSNHLTLNKEHLLARPLTRLFEEERKLVVSLSQYIKKQIKNIDQKGLTSIILDFDSLHLYVVLRTRGIAKELTERLEEICTMYKINVVETSVEEFMKIQDERSSFLLVVTGEKPPFKSMLERLRFFDFE